MPNASFIAREHNDDPFAPQGEGVHFDERRYELVAAFATMPDSPFGWILELASTAAEGAFIFPGAGGQALEQLGAAIAAYRAAREQT